MIQKCKIRDLTVYDVNFYFFTKIFAIIEIQNHQLIFPYLNINECKYNFSTLFSARSIKSQD